MRETIVRALRRQRVTTAVAVLLGLLWGVLTGWASRTGGPAALLMLPPLLMLAWSLVPIFGRPGTADLRVDEHEPAFFSAPRFRTNYRCAILGFLAYQVTYPALASPDEFWWIYPSISGPLTVVLTVAHWRRVPGVALTPTGITAGDPLRHVHVPWEALAPAAWVYPLRIGSLRLPVRSPESVRRGGIIRRRQVDVETWGLDVAPELLAGAIAHYAAHPEHRAAIGTPEEYARLRHVLAGGG
ncbi:hypothetical protein AB0B83_02195 [Micromonospora sp. NPDC049060]|uniref:hypothetical protein n=1 Tax=Micromonospora sp. NPDC049060 TaxID=3154828 RepID=UPI0034010004